MNAATRSARDAQPRRFYASDYRRRLRDAGALATISTSANVVLAALCDRANAAGMAWPSVETIAKDYGLGESTVRRAIGELVAAGLVLAVRRAGKVSRYVLATPKAAEEPSAPTIEDGGDPSRIGRSPLSNRAPNTISDHDQDHQEQHDSAVAGADVVVEDGILIGESAAASPPADASGDDGIPITMLEPELAERARAIGLHPAKVTRFGAERVRRVLDALEAERMRKAIGNPAGWVMKALIEKWEVAVPVVQRVFGEGSTAENMPPEGTRWARPQGAETVCGVRDINDARVQLDDGTVVPAHHWGRWEWLAEPRTTASAAIKPGESRLEPANATAAPEKRTALARVAAWAAVRPRPAAELATKLAAAGLTDDEWEAHQANRTWLEVSPEGR